MSERPTPETDAAILASNGQWSFVLRETCERMERERDEARACEIAAIVERERWKMQAEEKWAMRRELEEILGVQDGAPCDEQFAKGLEALRQLKSERDEARAQYQTTHILANSLAKTQVELKAERDEAREALVWCAEWLDTLSDHLHGKDMAREMLEDLCKTRRDNPAMDEVFASIGWTREAEANFFKARLIPEEGEE